MIRRFGISEWILVLLSIVSILSTDPIGIRVKACGGYVEGIEGLLK
jgi:hypothetical protein